MIYPAIYLANFLLLYGAYLGAVFYPFGARRMLMDSLILACFYGLAAWLHSRYGERGAIYSRFGFGILGLACFLLLGTAADRIFYLPLFFGVFLLILRNIFHPDYYRIVTAFDIHWKAAIPMLVLGGIICGFDAVRFVFLPLGSMAVILQIFLMRILRHEPTLWKNRSIVKANCLPMLPGVIGSLLFAFWGQNQPVGEVTVGFYQGVIVPLLRPFIYLWTAIGVFIIHPIIRFIFSLMGSFKNQEMPEELGSNLEKMLLQSDRQAEYSPLLLIILFLILLTVLILLLLRWLGNNSPIAPQMQASIYETERRSIQLTRESESAAGKKVRELYKTYLRNLKKKKVKLQPSDTTEDILNKSPDRSEDKEIRALYLKTRYQNQTEDSDEAKMKELLTKLIP